MINWYEKIGGSATKQIKPDKNFKKHMILPNSMILCIGGTGSGKTNALINFINLKNNAFYEILIFTGSTADEPIYNYLQEKCPDIKVYTDINEFPDLSSFEDSKDKEKLVVFDDFINLSKKEMVKINKYLTSGRKFGITVFLNAQNYVSVSKTIVRNCNYFILFKINDTVSINNIIKNHNINDLDKEKFKEAYRQATSQPLDFLVIDLKNRNLPSLRRNFTETIQL